jgi:hypothetical protein
MLVKFARELKSCVEDTYPMDARPTKLLVNCVEDTYPMDAKPTTLLVNCVEEM